MSILNLAEFAAPSDLLELDPIAAPDAIFKTRPNLKSLSIDELLKVANTGDILLFNALWKDSNNFKVFQKSVFSHVGIIYFDPDHPGIPFIYESTGNQNIPDFDTKVCRKGVQVIPLKERLLSYWGNVVYRPLHWERKPEKLKALHDFRKSLIGTNYESHVFEAIRALLKANKKENLTEIFCSELVAAIYKVLGILDHTQMSNNFWPSDFSATPLQPLPLVDGATLGEEFLVPRAFPPSKVKESEWLIQMGHAPSREEYATFTDDLVIELHDAQIFSKSFTTPHCSVEFFIGLFDHDQFNLEYRHTKSKTVVGSKPVWNQKLHLKYPGDGDETPKYILRVLLNHDLITLGESSLLGNVSVEDLKLVPGESKFINLKVLNGEVTFTLTRVAKQSKPQTEQKE